MKNNTRNAVFALISCIIFGLSFVFIGTGKSNGFVIEAPATISTYGDNRVDIKKNSGEEWISAASSNQILFYGDGVRTTSESEAVIDFASKVIARVSGKTEVYLESSDKNPKDYYLNLAKGEIWVNTVASSSDFKVKVDKSTISAIDAVFDVSMKEKNVFLRVISGNVKIAADYGLLISPGNQISFNTSSMADPGRDVYQIGIDSEWLHGDWYLANLSKDDQYRDITAKDLRDSIQAGGFNYGQVDSTGFSINQYLKDAKSFLTFSDTKKKEAELGFISKLIDDGVYYLSVDNKQSADDVFAFVLNTSGLLSKESLADFKSALFVKFNKLKIFTRKYGNLYAAKNKIRDLFLSTSIYDVLNPDEKIYLARGFLFDAVFDVLNPDAQNLALSYFRSLFRAVRNDKEHFGKYLAEDNKLVYNAILDNPVFYRKDIFALKSELENMMSANDRNLFVQERVRLLKNIKEFVLEERLIPRDALTAANFINDELKEKDTGVFVSDLEKLQDFIAFLNDRNYTETSIHGDTMSDRYVAYLTLQREQLQLEEFKKSIGVGAQNNKTETPDVDIDKIKRSIVDAFDQYGVKIEEFGDVVGGDAKYITIKKAVKDDVVFSAKYNRDGDVVSEIKTENGYEFPLAVRPDKLGAALSALSPQDGFASAPILESIDKNVQPTNSSGVEASAKSIVSKKLSEFDIKANVNQILVVNILTKEFRVEGAKIDSEKEKITVSFDLKDPFTEASGIELKTSKGSVKYEDAISVPLQDLASKITVFSEKVYYDQLDKEIEETKNK